MSPEQFRRIEELFHSVREANPEQRAALLSRIAPAIRHQIESLLSHSHGCEFLDRPAIQNAPELLADPRLALREGEFLGPYRIEGRLGEGGMGEVFRAVDTRLGRGVAIKLAREEFTSGCEREARAIASLNHPNICQLYDVGPNFLVMELVEGPTLADRLRAGPIPLDEALAIARQIGDALEAAHEKGIVHRDLKPANIKITPEDTVKVLDFGLARIAEQSAPATESLAHNQTTVPGRIMGTAAYMAPEQARGKSVDKRADIWAFGVLLYEMLTGRGLFSGESISDTLSAVLTKEPEWQGVPTRVRPLLKSCLEKAPNRRLRDIADAWILLDETPATAPANRVPWIAVGVLAMLTALALWAPWRGAPNHMDPPSPRFDLDLGANVSLAGDAGPAVALSPNGTRFVFVSHDQEGVPRLFQRKLDQSKAVLLPGTDGAKQPFFSPDGQWVGFFAGGKLKKTRIDGGEPVSLCDAPSGRGANWADDGNIVAALDPSSGLSLVPSSGSNPVSLTELQPGEASHRWPHVLPGSKFVFFTASSVVNNHDEADIALLSLEDKNRKTLLHRAGMYPRYLTSGHLVYVTKGSLFAAPFDLKHGKLTGASTRLGEVAADIPIGFAQVDFSTDGICAIRTRGQAVNRPQWLDSAGVTESLGLETARYHYLRLSPDGARLAYVLTDGPNSDLFIYDWRRGIKTRLTNGRVTRAPVWSPDGRFVVFAAAGGMFVAQTDGGGTSALLTRSNNLQGPETFSPDGQLVFAERGELFTLPIEGDGSHIRAGLPKPFFTTASRTWFPSFSPDGHWMAYSNARSGQFEVYVRAFPDDGRQVQVSDAGGILPFWSRNGHELFYRTIDQRIMAAEYTVQGGAFISQRPRPWYGKKIANVGDNRNLDIAVDGRRFVVLTPAEATDAPESQSHVTLVVNFFDEVRRRVAGQTK